MPPPPPPGAPAVPPPDHISARPDPTQATPAPSFRLGSASYAPGADIAVHFASPVASPANHRAWLAIASAGSPPSSYDNWDWVADGATAATLKAPTQPGAYEVRLHTDYPAKQYNVRQSIKLTVGAAHAAPSSETPRAQQRFTLRTTTLHPGEAAQIDFATALHAAPGEQFWVTVVAKGAADTSWGKYDYVPDGARAMQLAVPAKPGDYELRLHANYPRLTTNVVDRVAITVVQ